MELKQLEYIIAIAETQSLSRAADRLFLSPSALSQYVKRLEEREHLPPLFYRDNGTFQLTDAGRIYVNGARTIQKLISKTEPLLFSGYPMIRLSASPILEFRLLTQVLPKFRKEYPETTLSITFLDTIQAKSQLEEGQLDMAIILNRQKRFSAFYSIPLYEDQVIWVASERFLEGRNTPPSSWPVILPPPNTPWRNTCTDIISQESLTGEIYCESKNPKVVEYLLKEYPITAFMLESEYGAQSGLHILPLRRTYPYYISVLMPRNTTPFPAIAFLLEQVKEYLDPYRHDAKERP